MCVSSGRGGLSDGQETELHAILQDRGVPAAEVKGRLQAAVKKLVGPVAQAMQSQALKAAGNKPGITPDELQAHIQAKAATKFGAQVNNAWAKKQKQVKAGRMPLQVDPRQLQLPPGSFVSSGGTPLGQLDFDEVQAQATGVCFCTPAQARPFVADAKNLSVDALALLITAPIPPADWVCS